MDYQESGVSIEAGNEAARRIAAHAKRTFTPNVLTGIGGFSSLFNFDSKKYQEPVLVSSTDGVGTKVMIAQLVDRHHTIGIDLVAMAVNDLICMGADPLFFLDYIACGQLIPDKIEQIIQGISAGCVDAGCALIGGETAEMPGIYKPSDYDLAGFVVGVVDKAKIISGQAIKSGDILVGIRSSGLHSNGYSLARKVLFEKAGFDCRSEPDGLRTTLGDELLIPTRIYVSLVKKLKEAFVLSGIAHITGGAFYDKIIRIVPEKLGIEISRDSWPVPPIFELIAKHGEIAWEEMHRAFNMGIGLVVIVPGAVKKDIIAFLQTQGEKAYIIGQVTEHSGKVEFI